MYRDPDTGTDVGFTLVELLVVVVIIGVLAGIAIPVFVHERRRGENADMQSDLRSAAIVASTITIDDPRSTLPYTLAGLEAQGWRHNTDTVFTLSGSPAGGDFCMSAHNSKGTTRAGSDEFRYDEKAGGLQPDLTTACP